MPLDHEHFVQAVADQGGLPDPGRAEACAATALECLGQRLNGGTARALAEHLPEPDASRLTAHTRADEGRPGDMSDLAEDLATRAGLEPMDAQNVLQAVIRVIAESVGDEDQLNRVRDQLPPDLARMFGRTEESEGRYRRHGGV
jgi:uncharacterized protein (DUF2267 family)